MIKKFIISLLLISGTVLGQDDSLSQYIEKNARAIDSLKLIVKDIVVSGNKITKDEVILREMSLKRGTRFTIKKYSEDVSNIYNLGLFTRVDIIPVSVDQKRMLLNVDVNERWYILPLPNAGIEDGEWKKLWASLNLKWQNFRGRNETVSLYGRIFYNPSVSFTYSVPWIGEKLHMFTSYSLGYSKYRNQSLLALGRGNTGDIIAYNDVNYDNINFHTDLTIGKYITRRFSIFTDIGYNYTRVTEYAPGRTISSNGIDRIIGVSLGTSYDSRDIREYATKGYYLNTSYTRNFPLYNLPDYSRFALESQEFIPVYLAKHYYLTVASRFYTNFVIGSNIPYYDHQYLGYSDNYVRGWQGTAYEGEGVLTVFNEIRFPVITPRYIKAKNVPIARNLPILKNMDLRYGLYLTLLSDVGTVFNHEDNIFKKRFLSSAGFGINIVAPFGYVLRADWAFRLAKPVVGRINLNLHAKF